MLWYSFRWLRLRICCNVFSFLLFLPCLFDAPFSFFSAEIEREVLHPSNWPTIDCKATPPLITINSKDDVGPTTIHNVPSTTLTNNNGSHMAGSYQSTRPVINMISQPPRQIKKCVLNGSTDLGVSNSLNFNINPNLLANSCDEFSKIFACDRS